MVSTPLLVAVVLTINSAVLSAAVLIVMWRDKRAAARGGWRTPESTLHLLELLGGWPGSFASQRLFRHKTAKRHYFTRFLLAAIGHIALCIGAVWIAFR